MAALNPVMSVEGTQNEGDIIDVLSEIQNVKSEQSKKKINITTDEIEEKDVAIQMITVFIDELGGAFAEWIEPTSKLLLSLLNFEANDSIRNSSAAALPGLTRCVKEANPQNMQYLTGIARSYIEGKPMELTYYQVYGRPCSRKRKQTH